MDKERKHALDKQYRERNKERIAQNHKEWRMRNKKKLQVNSQRYYNAHYEEISERQRERYATKPKCRDCSYLDLNSGMMLDGKMFYDCNCEHKVWSAIARWHKRPAPNTACKCFEPREVA